MVATRGQTLLLCLIRPAPTAAEGQLTIPRLTGSRHRRLTTDTLKGRRRCRNRQSLFLRQPEATMVMLRAPLIATAQPRQAT